MKFAIALLLVAAGSAHADSGLVWNAPPACPDLAAVQVRVAARAATDTGQLDEPVRVAVAEADGRFSARVEIGDAPARTLSAASCDALADAVAVIVARLVHEPAPAPEVAAKVPPVESAAPLAIARPAARRWHVGARATGVAAEGVLPGTGVGGAAAVFGQWGSAYAAVGGEDWASSPRPVAAPRPGFDHVDISLQAATMELGWVLPGMPARVFATGELGTMSGIGQTTASGRWLAIGAGAAMWWQAIPHVRLVISASVADARERVKFMLDDGTTAYEPEELSIRAAAGLELDVP